MRKSLLAGLLSLGLVASGWAVLSVATSEVDAAQRPPLENDFPFLEPVSIIEGKASWYGPGFHGRTTASGIRYNRYAMTAAHRSLRYGTVVRVTNLRNQRSAVLVINDWGPVPAEREIDVSEAAADVLGFRQ
ncbi:MAG: septal ring lytic transglycosylase RlpA family protein, partial [Terriglobia bacterium]